MRISFKNGLKQCPEGCPFLQAEFTQLYDPMTDSWTLTVLCSTRPCKWHEVIEVEVVE